MVIYWDASALIPLLLKEETSASHRKVARDSTIVTWWGSFVECASAIARKEREGTGPTQVAESRRMLEALAEEWREVGPSEQLRRATLRALRAHALRASDALHIGAALVASGFEPHTIRFRTEDRRLKVAAQREGFAVD
jgi:predicted nucleic acid-binding protein